MELCSQGVAGTWRLVMRSSTVAVPFSMLTVPAGKVIHGRTAHCLQSNCPLGGGLGQPKVAGLLALVVRTASQACGAGQ
jgi:hypothetical protein